MLIYNIIIEFNDIDCCVFDLIVHKINAIRRPY